MTRRIMLSLLTLFLSACLLLSLAAIVAALLFVRL